MSRRQALLLGMLCAAGVVFFVVVRDLTGILAFASGTILFSSIWFFKYQRDRRITASLQNKQTSPAQDAYVNQAQVANLSQEAYGQFLTNYYQLGIHPETGAAFLVSMLDRYSGMYILGSQGGGKTGLLKNLIHQDILSGNSIVVVDPHGDLTKDCIEELPDFLPSARREKIYLLDMEDEQYPFGLNIFAGAKLQSNIALAQHIDRVMHVFGVSWPEVMSQHYLPRYLLIAAQRCKLFDFALGL